MLAEAKVCRWETKFLIYRDIRHNCQFAKVSFI
ncbi:hypothetical protein T11_11600 [Trichinella zimbabwensis]|uniref:Uncharacterized protein n=1 Tax=Trichinella zimbabwensis TaxID=268475 RepID=A0A0V1GBE6_9BILA|nr:hypothetical protein T11_11600 [Trichinella zimbabwensis]